ncbi:hypothetical protein LTR37_002555 [Vermiconidia calcicola]|uniref:Uncharacterized protein n=1 Tax=Vermiconidia calcicola TaxID=1690605 RepID=A0ACC3NSY5_9PEZI|nr:hypothetical protein LTR37_002555 [Vermiconidia calcicola]
MANNRAKGTGNADQKTLPIRQDNGCSHAEDSGPVDRPDTPLHSQTSLTEEKSKGYSTLRKSGKNTIPSAAGPPSSMDSKVVDWLFDPDGPWNPRTAGGSSNFRRSDGKVIDSDPRNMDTRGGDGQDQPVAKEERPAGGSAKS